MAKAKFPIMTLTDAAADRVRTLMAGQDAVGLRVGVRNGGCAGMSYTLDYVREIGPYGEQICGIQTEKINSRLAFQRHICPDIQFGESRQTRDRRKISQMNIAHAEGNYADPATSLK